MKKLSILPIVILVSAGLLTGCETAENVEAGDVYKVACPLVDASNGGNKMSKKAAEKTIQQLKKQDIDEQAKKFLNLAELFVSEDDSKASKEAKKQVKKLCKDKADYTMKSM